jgi:hypothetical protein
MAAACRWSVESGKLMYPSTFGHVPIRVYISYRLNDSFVPKQQRKKCMSVVHCDKNLDQQLWSWLKHYARSSKTAGSGPDEVIECFQFI